MADSRVPEYDSSSSDDSMDEEMGEDALTPNSNSNDRIPRAVELEQPRGTRNLQGRICVTVEKNVFDCPICTKPLNPPIYQCGNGHISCQSCCRKMKKKCRICSFPIGYIRCRALENVIESTLVSYPSNCGCVEYIKYGKKYEKTCIHAPCKCPFDACSHSDLYKDLHKHLRIEHSSSYKDIHFGATFDFSYSGSGLQSYVLVEKSEGIVFLLCLCHCINPVGMFGFVSCVAPTTWDRAFCYQLAAVVGNRSMKLKDVVEHNPHGPRQRWSKRRLIVPGQFMNPEISLLHSKNTNWKLMEETKWEVTIWPRTQT